MVEIEEQFSIKKYKIIKLTKDLIIEIEKSSRIITKLKGNHNKIEIKYKLKREIVIIID